MHNLLITVGYLLLVLATLVWMAWPRPWPKGTGEHWLTIADNTLRRALIALAIIGAGAIGSFILLLS